MYVIFKSPDSTYVRTYVHVCVCGRCARTSSRHRRCTTHQRAIVCGCDKYTSPVDILYVYTLRPILTALAVKLKYSIASWGVSQLWVRVTCSWAQAEIFLVVFPQFSFYQILYLLKKLKQFAKVCIDEGKHHYWLRLVAKRDCVVSCYQYISSKGLLLERTASTRWLALPQLVGLFFDCLFIYISFTMFQNKKKYP